MAKNTYICQSLLTIATVTDLSLLSEATKSNTEKNLMPESTCTYLATCRHLSLARVNFENNHKGEREVGREQPIRRGVRVMGTTPEESEKSGLVSEQ